LAKFDESGRRLPLLPDKDRPFARDSELPHGDGPAAPWRAEIVKRTDRAHGDRRWLAADAEAGDGAGRQRIRERLRLGVDDMPRRAAQTTREQAIREQTAKRAAVVDVEPLGGRDESAAVARPGEFACLEEKMDMQAGELAGADAKAVRRGCKPVLRWLVDAV